MNNKKQLRLINEYKGQNRVRSNYLDNFYKKEKMLAYQEYQEAGNKVWYSGDSGMIRAYFSRSFGTASGYNPMENSFWRNVAGNVSIVHIPVASSISEIMSNVLFGRLPKIQADTKNKTTNKKIDKQLEELLDYANISQSLQTASQLESYSGSVAGRIVIDEDFDHPVIQWFPAENIELHEKFGKVCEVVFIEKIVAEPTKKEYELHSIYGLGYVRYELFYSSKQVPLTEIKETSELCDFALVDESGEPINMLLCVYKQNRVANNLHANAKGDSDFTGLWNIFDSIDESASAMVDNIKKSRTYTFIPERMLEKDQNGNIMPNKAYGIDVWDVGRVAEPNEKLPSRDVVHISVDPYIVAIRDLTKIALNRVGLSPTTFGLDDSGANASGEALNIRDSRTEKTFKDKSQLWKPQIENLAKLLYMFEYIKNNNYVAMAESIVIPSNIANVNFIATFPAYREVSIQDKFSKWIEMIDNGAMTVDYALKESVGDEIPEAELENIKQQLGIGEEKKPPMEQEEDNQAEEENE